MRPIFIAGNWKMNPSSREASVALAQAVKDGVGSETAPRVALCPPSLFLPAVDEVLAGSPIGLGGQNLHGKPDGAYTGEVCGPMLVDVGCTHVIIGHSERRHGMGETDAMVNDKIFAALKAGLIPIVCLGETLDEREGAHTESVVSRQLKHSLQGLEPDQMASLVLAYEPVWAIGTGKVATPDQAQAVHKFIREILGETFGEATAARVVVQYGGSVKPDNARDLLAQPDIDGALVGGASLKAADFLGIIAAGRDVTTAGKA